MNCPAESSTPRPRVDVGVVTWNTRDLTVECLRRLIALNDDVELRILVRDNASADGTAEAIRAAIPQAEVDAGDVNLGFAAGLNTLLARSDAPWFLALNSDAWPEPGAIATLVRAAEDHPGAALIAPRLERPDGALEHSTPRFPSLRFGAIAAFGANRWLGSDFARRWLIETYWLHDEPCTVDWAVGAAWLMRRSAIDDVGPLDERYFMYVEDLEWCWRANQRGWEVRFEPAAVVRHIGNASGEQAFGPKRTEAWLRNTYKFYGDVHGEAAALVFRGLNIVAAARLYSVARWRHNLDERSRWAQHLRASVRP